MLKHLSFVQKEKVFLPLFGHFPRRTLLIRLTQWKILRLSLTKINKKNMRKEKGFLKKINHIRKRETI
jgi:hypothetical protein